MVTSVQETVSTVTVSDRSWLSSLLTFRLFSKEPRAENREKGEKKIRALYAN